MSGTVLIWDWSRSWSWSGALARKALNHRLTVQLLSHQRRNTLLTVIAPTFQLGLRHPRSTSQLAGRVATRMVSIGTGTAFRVRPYFDSVVDVILTASKLRTGPTRHNCYRAIQDAAGFCTSWTVLEYREGLSGPVAPALGFLLAKASVTHCYPAGFGMGAFVE